MILNILNVCCLKYFEILGEIHNKYKWSQQDFQRPHKHSSHAGSCLEMLVWMTLNWWYDKLKSGKVFNVKNPHPRTFSSHHIAVFYLAQDFYKQALILSKQLLCCFFNEKQYKSGYHITFNTLCTVKRDNKRSRMLECKQTIIITTSILLTVQLCVSSPLITALLWWFNINLFIHLLLNIKQSNIKETEIWNINDVIFFSKLEISCPFLGRYLTLKWQPGVTEWKEIARF